MEASIKCTIVTDTECTEQEFEEWVNFNLGYSSSISTSNPLHREHLDIDDLSIEINE